MFSVTSGGHEETARSPWVPQLADNMLSAPSAISSITCLNGAPFAHVTSVVWLSLQSGPTMDRSIIKRVTTWALH
jgi:hypothetical protein